MHDFGRRLVRPAKAYGELEASGSENYEMGSEESPTSKRHEKGDKYEKGVTNILIEWFLAHIDKPYPNLAEQMELAEKCSLDLTQVRNCKWKLRSCKIKR